MTRSDREALIGASVLVAGVLVLGIAFGASSRADVAGYDVSARFNRAEGVGIGSDVRLAGVTVGKVVGQTLDPDFRAVLTFRLAPEIKLPKDSAALIYTDGLLGVKYIALQPGGDEAVLGPGQRFSYTQDSVNVSDLMELVIAQGKAKRAGKPEPAAQP